jgi:HSP20 family protein
MADLSVRHEPQQTTPARREWDPFVEMRRLLRWDPFRELATPWPLETETGFMPAFDVKETKEGFEIHADLPGVKENDLEVLVTGNRLSVRGKRESEKKEQTDTYYVYERNYGSFTRSFTLPEGADAAAVKAELKDGVLDIKIGRKAEVQPKKIAVKTEVKPEIKK